jgi:site-specific recombinase XerD
MEIINLMERELSRRNYSLKTIKTYNYSLNNFFNFVKKDFKKINKQDINAYFYYLADKNISGSTINVNLNAIKFFYQEILNKKLTIKIKYSKVPKKLPLFLTQDEIIKLIDNIENNKHKLMIKLLYSSGLRVSELLNLKVRDFDFENDYGWVRQGKGNKDRIFVIAISLKQDLIDYVKDLDYDSFLFTSYNGRMSVRTIQEIIKKATKRSKINKKIHPHSLRHSYATHLIENGYDVSSVQSLLGHKSLETTMIYLHIAPKRFINVKSPLDNLKFNNLSYDGKNINDIEPISQEDKDLRI